MVPWRADDSPSAGGAAACATLGAWRSCGALALTDEPFPERLGLLPPLWTLGAAALVAIGLVVALRPAVARLLPLFFSAVLVLPWLPGPVPGAFLIWVRPVTWGVSMAIGLAMLAVVHRPAGRRASRPWLGDPQRAPLVVGAVAWGAYLAVAPQFSAIRPSSDEPHYLVITQSLLADGDLRIENNHVRGDYRGYFRGVLRPDYLKRGQDGEIYSIHLPGVSVFVAPAFAVGGYAAVRLWLSLLAALVLGREWNDPGILGFGTQWLAWIWTSSQLELIRLHILI